MVVLYKAYSTVLRAHAYFDIEVKSFYQMAMNLGTDKEVAQKGVVNVVYIHT